MGQGIDRINGHRRRKMFAHEGLMPPPERQPAAAAYA